MIVAAAWISGADLLYSEDMHDGFIVRQGTRVLEIVNPFKEGL